MTVSHGIKLKGVPYLDQIHLSEAVVVPRLLNVENRDDVLVVKVAEELHFSKRSQTEHGMVERGDLLDGDFLARGFVYRRATSHSSETDMKNTDTDGDIPDHTVGTLADNILNVILLAHVEGDLAGVGPAGLVRARHCYCSRADVYGSLDEYDAQTVKLRAAA